MEATSTRNVEVVVEKQVMDKAQVGDAWLRRTDMGSPPPRMQTQGVQAGTSALGKASGALSG